MYIDIQARDCDSSFSANEAALQGYGARRTKSATEAEAELDDQGQILQSSPEQFRKLLLTWYDEQARELPWRESRDPYRVWVSEIMLQQTRVAAVIAHYHEFLRRFPTVEKLARAREASVLAAWSGLGYYRRARMMHAAAKVVTRKLAGRFPESGEDWRRLPGVGRYTAAAVASIAFGEPAALVDGNVERVLQRVSGRRMAGEELWSAAGALLDRERPGDFNQAMMELGAVVCTPRTPACLTCPVVELCGTRGELERPRKPVPQKKREIHYALDMRDGAVFLVQRPRHESLMAGMWELPELAAALVGGGESRSPRFARNDRKQDRYATNNNRNDETKHRNYPKPDQKREKTSRSDSAPLRGFDSKSLVTGTHANVSRNYESGQLLFTLRHSITVTDYTVRVWRQAAPDQRAGQWISARGFRKLAMTGLARKILREAGLF